MVGPVQSLNRARLLLSPFALIREGWYLTQGYLACSVSWATSIIYDQLFSPSGCLFGIVTFFHNNSDYYKNVIRYKSPKPWSHKTRMNKNEWKHIWSNTESLFISFISFIVVQFSVLTMVMNMSTSATETCIDWCLIGRLWTWQSNRSVTQSDCCFITIHSKRCYSSILNPWAEGLNNSISSLCNPLLAIFKGQQQPVVYIMSHYVDNRSPAQAK